ncbi:GNAT family N-acetyltransferase [Lentimicrobium sp. S6]|uniref:GNAT family N-acetyltransferase n=1 Tax=Lentimicrobium sp. S6 TaxID=2735872 RepID=UPI001553F48A|nr:GNAT family N-acetyltransferase [Lentimicrobium sp. S6]NPD45088.1 GNAT family N-acetyltransferase [Lentimicrobium sp. S6]
MGSEKYINLDEDNISDEHICCAFSDKKCSEGYQLKKEWLKKQFKDGYVFRKLDERGKIFIEYVPAEKAWAPIIAPNYMLINCFWVSGKFKGEGHGKELYQYCLEDAKEMDGLVVMAASRKQPFMSDKKFFIKQGFLLADTAPPYFELWYKPLKANVPIPKFKEIAKTGKNDIKDGLVVYFTNACPFNEYYVNTELKAVAEKQGVNLTIKKLASREQAQNHFVPHTLYSIFYNGEFITQHILNEKAFDRFIQK